VEDTGDDIDPPGEDCYIAWQWCVSSDWKSLPEDGGLFDQDERLMNGVFLISARHRVIKEHMKVDRMLRGAKDAIA
jgi:hypothetical protein